MQHSCPPWCNRVHEVADDFSVSHRSEVVAVPAIVRYPDASSMNVQLVAVNLALGLEQRSGETWVWISPEDDVARGIVMSAESGRRLSRQLISLLGECERSSRRC